MSDATAGTGSSHATVTSPINAVLLAVPGVGRVPRTQRALVAEHIVTQYAEAVEDFHAGVLPHEPQRSPRVKAAELMADVHGNPAEIFEDPRFRALVAEVDNLQEGPELDERVEDYLWGEAGLEAHLQTWKYEGRAAAEDRTAALLANAGPLRNESANDSTPALTAATQSAPEQTHAAGHGATRDGVPLEISPDAIGAAVQSAPGSSVWVGPADPALVQWQATLLSSLDGRDDFRVSAPLQTTDGQWTTHGWTAWCYQPGAHVPQRWHDIVAVGHLLHSALSTEPEPAFLHRRTDNWSIGDKVAWAELPAAHYAHTKHLPRLSAALRPVEGRSQLIHGDLTGNVLFHDTLPPLVIDLSPYWRPPAFASAIVIADALVFESAPEDIVKPMLKDPDFPQYLLRALIYRIVTDDLARPQQPRLDTDDPYLAAVELATRLTRAA